MMTLDDVRKKYPQYSKIPDKDLADKLHAKFYPNSDKKEFYNKIGFKEETIPDILKRKALKSWNDDKPLIDTGRLIKAGLMGLGEAGQNIASTLTGGYSPKVNMKETFGMENPSIPEKLVAGASQYAPLLAAGPMGLAADTAAGAAYGASQSPENKTKGAEIGGGSNAAFNLAGKVMEGTHPLAKLVSKALLGGSIGYGVNGNEGAIEGAVAAPILPKILKKAGFAGNPAEDIMKSVKPSEVADRAAAGMRLKTPLTPGEASGRPDVTAEEAAIGKHGEAAQERVKIGKQRIEDQKKAINELHKTISPSDEIASFSVRKAAQDSIDKMKAARQEAAQPFYDIAHEKKVAPNLIKNLRNSDANIDMAIDEAMNDPKYQVEGELKGYSENNIKVLDYAKRKIDAKISQAENFGDNDAVRVLTKSKNHLLDKIEHFSPDFKKARDTYSELSKPIEEVENSKIGQIANLKDVNLKNVSKNIFDPSQTDPSVLRKIKEHVQKEHPEAWDHIIKNEMNRLMTQGKNRGITGRSFFDNVLSNDRRFEQFQIALEHNPKALSQLNDMKSAWEHLINIETPRTAAGQAKTSMGFARSSLQSVVDHYNQLVGPEKHIKALNYLYSDKWVKDLIKVKNLPKKEQKGMMSILIGKTIAPAYSLEDEGKK